MAKLTRDKIVRPWHLYINLRIHLSPYCAPSTVKGARDTVMSETHPVSRCPYGTWSGKERLLHMQLPNSERA